MSSQLLCDFWYAVQVKPKAEVLASRLLTAVGYETFCPTTKQRRKWADRVKVVEEAAFAGYLFARQTGAIAARIVDAGVVIRIVGFGGEAMPVDETEMHSLRILFGSGIPTSACSFSQPGDPIKVRHGPLKGVEGKLLRRSQRCTVIVSVSLLQRSIMAEVEEADVWPVGRPHFVEIPPKSDYQSG